jgi:hypothetical protein
LAVLALALFVLVPSSGAIVGFSWEMDFEDQFQMPPIPGFGSEMSLPEEISNLSDETDVSTEPTGGRRLVMEDLSPLRPDSNSGEEDDERYHRANFSFELSPGWTATSDGNRDEGNLSLERACALVRIGWFEDSGVDPESCLRQVVRAYRSESLRFPVLTAEAGEPLTVDGQRSSSLNVYYRYGSQESQKRIVAWSSPVSGRFFYASFWSCPEAWDENLEKFELILESFRDEGSERYVVLKPRSATLDGWGTVLLETLSSYHFASFATPPNPEVGVRVVMKSHREGGQVNQLASEEIVSSIRGGDDPPREGALQKLLQDRGYRVAILRRGGAYWVVVQDPEGEWQAISSAALATERGLGALVGPEEEEEWYRGLVVEGPEEIAREKENGSSGQTVIEKDCDPPREVHLKPNTEVNLTWVLGLRDLLDRYSYTHNEPDQGSFLRAQVCWALLEREGYEAWLLTEYEGHPLRQEMWVVVRHPGDEGYVAVVTAAAKDHRGLGEIVCDPERFEGIAYETSIQYTCLHPDRGLGIDPGEVRIPAPVEAAS